MANGITEIRITCHTSEHCDLDKLEPLQGTLKKRTDEQIDKICRSVIKHRWAFPEFREVYP
jgi:hypothetical protein